MKEKEASSVITQANLKGIKVETSLWSEGDKQVSKEFLTDCHTVFINESFRKILTRLIEDQTNFTVNQSEDWSQVVFGRGTINGVCLVKESLERYNSLYLESIKRDEEFNKNDVI